MTMEYYIGQQPQLFTEALDNKMAIAHAFVKLYAKVQPDHLYLIASGTSRNGALAAAPFMEWVLNCPVTVLAPSCAYELKGSQPLAVFISQGGNSTNTIAAIERLGNVPALALTGNKDGKVNTLCHEIAEIPCGEELAGPKTKGYTMTILALYLMALEAGRACDTISKAVYNDILDVLQLAGAQYEENLKKARAWMEKNAQALLSMKVLYMAGKQQGAFVADESALKILETLLIPAVAFEFEEYLHGPTCSLSGEIAGFYLLPVPGDEDYERMQRLIAYHRQLTPNVFTVGLTASGDVRDCVLLTTGQWYTQPFEQILPMQFAGALLPDMMNIGDVGHQRFVALDNVMGVKFKPGN